MANPEHEKFLATVPLRDKIAAYMVTKGNDDLPLAHRIGVLRQWYEAIDAMAETDLEAIMANADRIIGLVLEPVVEMLKDDELADECDGGQFYREELLVRIQLIKRPNQAPCLKGATDANTR